MRKKLGIMLLAGTLAFQWNVPVLANQMQMKTISETPVAEAVKTAPMSQFYCGTITKVQKVKKRGITKIFMKSEQDGERVLNVSKDTVWINAKTRSAGSSTRLKVGEKLYVFHSIAMTRSLPPQTAAFAIVRNVPQDTMCPQYITVDQVEKQKDGSLQITTDDGEMILMLNKETSLIPYRTKNIVKLEDIEKGSRLMVWYSIVGTSYPARVYPEQVMLLPSIK